jgi:hypothetical protein
MRLGDVGQLKLAALKGAVGPQFFVYGVVKNQVTPPKIASTAAITTSIVATLLFGALESNIALLLHEETVRRADIIRKPPVATACSPQKLWPSPHGNPVTFCNVPF